MFKIERKIVEFVERNVNILFMLAITGLAIVVRYAGRDFVSGDMTWFLLGWFQKIADNGGIHSLKNQVGDYNILYQTIVALFTYIGDKSIYYKKFYIRFLIIRMNTILSNILKYRKTLILPRIYHD